MDMFDDMEEAASRRNRYVLTQARAHMILAARTSRHDRGSGVPVVIFSTIVGTAIFASLKTEESTGWQIATGALSVLQTFFGFSALAGRHRQAADGHYRIWRATRSFMFLIRDPDTKRKDAIEVWDKISSNLNAVDDKAPVVSDAIEKKARKYELKSEDKD